MLLQPHDQVGVGFFDSGLSLFFFCPPPLPYYPSPGKELKETPTASPLITTTTEDQVPAAGLANKASVKPADIDCEQIKSAVPSKGNDDKEVEAVPHKPADKTDPDVASDAAASVVPSAASAAASDIDDEFTAEKGTIGEGVRMMRSFDA